MSFIRFFTMSRGGSFRQSTGSIVQEQAINA